jgi:hypothetical protein
MTHQEQPQLDEDYEVDFDLGEEVEMALNEASTQDMIGVCDCVYSSVKTGVKQCRIRDVYPGSRIRLFSIPGSEFFPSRIPDPHLRSKVI